MQRIKRENVNTDLNCTLHDASIIDYMVDENGFLINEKGEFVFDDNGNIVKLTNDQIENFKENDMYEEVEI